MDVMPAERCYEPGGLHLKLLPWAWVFLFAYGFGNTSRCVVKYVGVSFFSSVHKSLCLFSAGIPLYFGHVLYQHRKAIHIDQQLRAKGDGNNQFTNPVYRVRMRYKKIYEDFKPDFYYWRITLMARKFCLAGTTLYFNRSPMFQASTAIGILFIAYILQARFKPYLERASISNALVEFKAVQQEVKRSKRAMTVVYNRRETEIQGGIDIDRLSRVARLSQASRVNRPSAVPVDEENKPAGLGSVARRSHRMSAKPGRLYESILPPKLLLPKIRHNTEDLNGAERDDSSDEEDPQDKHDSVADLQRRAQKKTMVKVREI
jgi:hypothetical protein